ncbi:bifunctional lysylphosphatidylglycerol flippase/synthetase MprF [Sphingomonas sp. CJ20]
MQVAGLDPALSDTAPRPRRLVDGVRRFRRPLAIAAVAVVAWLGFEALRTVLAEVHFRDVRAALGAIGTGHLLAALGFTALSYFLLTFYDWAALRTIGRKLPWRTAALASFTSYTLSNNLGLSLLTGGSARLRVYSAAGLEFADVARVTLIASSTFWGGILVTTAFALLVDPVPLHIAGFVGSVGVQRLLGAGALALFAVLIVARGRAARSIRLGDASVPIPGRRLLVTQIAVSTADLACASAALWVLVPNAASVGLGPFFLAYALAILVGLLSHVPGGVGVFEATILALVPIDRTDLFAALLLYRLVYYVFPLAVAGVALAAIEGRRLRRPLTLGLTVAGRLTRALAPSLLAALVFGAGLMLLVSGALPALHDRMISVRELVPLQFVETSHFAGSLIGTALLLIAPAVQARLKSGFHAARALMIAGALFSVLKGFDYEEAFVLLGFAGLLQFSKPAFYRRAGIAGAPIASWWWAAALIAIALSAWAGFFAYKHVPYSQALWWDFAWRGNAPRFLRATLGATVLVGCWALWRLMSAAPAVAPATDVPEAVAIRAMADTGRADAMLAYTGDKSFLVSTDGDAFLMYRVQGRTWIAMGDPVGPIEAWPELVWELRRRCDAARGRLCLFQVSTEMLPLIVSLGLQPMKYGDEAIVDLTHGFDLKGPAYKSLRHSINRAAGAGLSFDVIPADQVPSHAEALRAVSDAWLQRKPGAEKGFSLGRFDMAYLARFDCAVLRLEGRIVAFANIWETPNREEISVDLMRHVPDTPYGAMDLLFVRLFQYGAEQGFARFNLGMAPLSGLNDGPLAPVWSRLGAAVYGHGERLYGFSGLRSYKSKFAPDWVPRYVAVTLGLSVPRALIDLAALIGG